MYKLKTLIVLVHAHVYVQVISCVSQINTLKPVLFAGWIPGIQ